MNEVGTKGVARADRQHQLVQCAIAEFGRRGYTGASLTSIAQGAGVSKAMIYHLFGSKEGLSLACLEEVGPGLVHAVAEAQGASDPGDRALDTFTAIFSELNENRYAWAVIYDRTLPLGPAAVAADLRAQFESLGTLGTHQILFSAGIDDPVDHELLDRIWQSAVATTVQWWQGHDDLSAADMAARCARLLGVISPRA